MAYADAFHLPGTFYTDSAARPGLFRPPISSSPVGGGSPASSGYLPGRAMAAHATFNEVNTKRKRVNTGLRSREAEIADAAQPFFNMPSPHVFQPDSAVTAATCPDYGMSDSMFSDGDYRHMLGTKRTRDDVALQADQGESIFALQPHADEIMAAPPQKGWASLAYTTLGGVVGKVWDFCTAGAFRGFHAGGGQGYDARGIVDEVPNMQWERAEEKMVTEYQYRHARIDSEEPFCSGASTPTAPAPKRRQTGPTAELGKNWVMVDKSEERLCRPITSTSSYRSTPRTRNSGPSLATGRRISTPANRRTPNGRIMSSFHTPSTAPTRPASSTSLGASRTILPPASSASRTPVSQIPRPSSPYTSSPTPTRASMHRSRSSLSTTAPPPFSQPSLSSSSSSFRHSRSHSSASATGATSRTQGGRGQEPPADPSPRLSAEAKKLASRRQKECREADMRMNDFNRRLQDMIREGQQALGTSIEIDGDGDGEGWEDD